MGFEFPASGSRSFQDAAAAAAALPADDHLQRLAQMTQGVGHTKSDSESDPNSAQPDPALYHSAAAAAYVQQYGNWPNAYYQQFGQPMNPAAFSAWPAQCYAPPHWPNYGMFFAKILLFIYLPLSGLYTSAQYIRKFISLTINFDILYRNGRELCCRLFKCQYDRMSERAHITITITTTTTYYYRSIAQ